MKNIIFVYDNLEKIEDLIEISSNTSANIILTKSLQSGIKFNKREKADLFIIDSSFHFSENKIELLKEHLNCIKPLIIENKIDEFKDFFISKKKLIANIRKSTKILDENQKKSFRKTPVVFRSEAKFKNEIKAEVRRAKRYRYPLSVVLFKYELEKDIDDLIEYFSGKVREFDYLWVISENKFAMVLPHTAWNGAQILSNRLVKHVSEKYNFKICALKNQILSFKRVENDETFIFQIDHAIDNEFREINREIDFYVWKDELFNEFAEAKTIRIFNRYKGMLVSHDADIIYINGSLHLHNIRAIQQNIIDKEKVTYFYSSSIDKTIRAGIESLHKENRHAVLSSYEIVDPVFTKTNIAKLSIEEDIDVFIYLDDSDEVIKTKLYELSLDDLTVFSETQTHLQENQAIYIEFRISIRDKIYKIESNSHILQV
ncbi:hypothetical protein ThvES_00005550 [Thiovulum sp. ES]|nr:hypothetical protein ThvES_00005550 [Thiovulum sp. ES]